jgi:hypothetical protein
MRRTSAGGIKPPNFGQTASSDARTFLDFGGHFLSFGRDNFFKRGGVNGHAWLRKLFQTPPHLAFR